jgi:hypothetical protein
VRIYLHVKSGRYYAVLHTAIDTTNARNGGSVVVYRRVLSSGAVTEMAGPYFVRDAAEFDEIMPDGHPRFVPVATVGAKPKPPGPKS